MARNYHLAREVSEGYRGKGLLVIANRSEDGKSCAYALPQPELHERSTFLYDFASRNLHFRAPIIVAIIDGVDLEMGQSFAEHWNESPQRDSIRYTDLASELLLKKARADFIKFVNKAESVQDEE